MDINEYEKPKVALKRFSDHELQNVLQPVAKKPRPQEGLDSSSPTPCTMVKNHLTLKDLERCLFSKNNVRVINVKPPAVTQQSKCFWCDASSTNPDFQCPRHKHKKLASQQIAQMPLALRSLPPEVGLCTSSIPGAGCGICAKRKIPVGAWIGPYEGNFVKPEELSPTTDTSYMWEIFKDGKLLGYMDGSDLNVTSWMRFIRCARHKQEQNLFAFQYLGRVFYRTFKPILPGQEMLVWYDEKYPQYLGIPWTIFDMGAVIPRGVSSKPDEVIVVSPRKEDRQPLNLTTQDLVFPSPPPSPISNLSSPLTPTLASLTGNSSPTHLSCEEKLCLNAASCTMSLTEKDGSLLKQRKKNSATDTHQTRSRSAPFLTEKRSLTRTRIPKQLTC